MGRQDWPIRGTQSGNNSFSENLLPGNNRFRGRNRKTAASESKGEFNFDVALAVSAKDTESLWSRSETRWVHLLVPCRIEPKAAHRACSGAVHPDHHLLPGNDARAKHLAGNGIIESDSRGNSVWERVIRSLHTVRHSICSVQVDDPVNGFGEMPSMVSICCPQIESTRSRGDFKSNDSDV